jgi:hypothetical protein
MRRRSRAGPAVVGDLDAKPTTDDGIGDLERAVAEAKPVSQESQASRLPA